MGTPLLLIGTLRVICIDIKYYKDMNKKKATTSKSMYYLGGAVYEGQNIPGVEKAPKIIRDAHLFAGLNKKYGV